MDAVTKARIAYELAKLDAPELNAVKACLGVNHPDGTAVSLRALRIQSHATARYMEAIRELTAFSLDGVIPERLRKPE